MTPPALGGYDLSQFAPSCYLVGVGEEAGVSGPVIEGEQRLFKGHRIGGRIRLMPTAGPRESIWARQSDLRGVVVSQARRYAW